jgi:N-acetylmuramoyl-L-alanine amidase
MKPRPLKTIFLFISIVFGLTTYGKSPSINVIYPKQNSTIGAVDSTFILGSVIPETQLIINGTIVPVHKEGGFIAFLPIKPGLFHFNITAINNSDTTFLKWPVNVPEPKRSFSYDSLRITDWIDSAFSVAVTGGDRLNIDFQATPGCGAYFSIPGCIDSVPMAELSPKIQPYWGESVFGLGAVPESLKITGYYSGFHKIGNEGLPDSSRVCYHLRAPDFSEIMGELLQTDAARFDFNRLSLLKFGGLEIIDSSDYFVQINPDDFPRTVEFTDSVRIIRVGPQRGYLTIFQPEGVKALALGKEGSWVKLKLSETQCGWVPEHAVKFLEPGYPPPVSYLKVIRTYSFDDRMIIEFPLADRHPFRIEEEDSHTILVYLYGVISETDWIRYDFKDTDLEIAAWSQPEPELYCLRLGFNRPIWGYDAYYESHMLKLQINKTPQDIEKLKHKIIIIDPGHSPDPGAIGPTGFKESEANLAISLALRRELEKRGANVIITREDTSALPLYDRPKIARAADADLFISIHNNALPDGVNPFLNNGTSSYYYHPHSIKLARAIHGEMLKETDLADYGLYHGNLAVNRPTQYPAVLVECTFIILPEEEARLKTEKFQKKLARAIRKGIEKFLKEFDRE